MQNDHFYIGEIRVERSSRVRAGHIQIETIQGDIETIAIDLSSLTTARLDITVITLPACTYDHYRHMKERQLRELLEEYRD
ncbi:MAG: hypothetical protein ACFHHU_00685 [Porticoccaceae bacterium]